MIEYLDEMPGIPLQDLWMDLQPVQAQAKEALEYGTQKPETLLERIVKASSIKDSTQTAISAVGSNSRQDVELALIAALSGSSYPY